MIKVEEILKRLVSFDTVGDKENGKIIDWIGGFSRAAGLETEKITNGKDGRVGLIVRNRHSGGSGLTFIGHTDTVPAGSGWKTDPFELTQKNNDFFGLGAADMKGGIAAMLAAVSETDLSGLRKGIELIFTYDEEGVLSGMKNIVAEHRIESDCIVIGEPTSLVPVVATKGALAFKIDFIGKEAHGSSPGRGVNAVEMASIFVVELKKNFKAIEKSRSRIFDSPSATLNIAKIAGGDATNKVPAACSLEFECRTIDDGQKEAIKDVVAALIKKNRFKAGVEMNFSLPVAKSLDAEFIAAIEKITKKKAVGVSYATEASLLPARNSFVILGPGSIHSAHQANESVSKKSLDKAVKIYGGLINKFCV